MLIQNRLLNITYFRKLFKPKCCHKTFDMYFFSSGLSIALTFNKNLQVLTKEDNTVNHYVLQHQNLMSFCHTCPTYIEVFYNKSQT